jgi:hypothetical protein
MIDKKPVSIKWNNADKMLETGEEIIIPNGDIAAKKDNLFPEAIELKECTFGLDTRTREKTARVDKNKFYFWILRRIKISNIVITPEFQNPTEDILGIDRIFFTAERNKREGEIFLHKDSMIRRMPRNGKRETP